MTEADKKKIEHIRDTIDEIDDEIFELFITRGELSYRIGQIKKDNDLPIIDENRLSEMIEDKIKRYGGNFVSEPFIRKIYGVIHEQSCIIQTMK